jgi:hypothetical protein
MKSLRYIEGGILSHSLGARRHLNQSRALIQAIARPVESRAGF